MIPKNPFKLCHIKLVIHWLPSPMFSMRASPYWKQLTAYCRIKCTHFFIGVVSFFFFARSQHLITRWNVMRRRNGEIAPARRKISEIKLGLRRRSFSLNDFLGRNSFDFHEQLKHQLTLNAEQNKMIFAALKRATFFCVAALDSSH